MFLIKPKEHSNPRSLDKQGLGPEPDPSPEGVRCRYGVILNAVQDKIILTKIKDIHLTRSHTLEGASYQKDNDMMSHSSHPIFILKNILRV